MFSVRQVATTLAVVMALGTLGGCSYLKSLIGLGPTRPRVRLKQVAVEKASLSKVDLKITVRVDNPNGFDLDFSRLDYEMTTTGQRIAAGQYEKRIVIPAEKHSTIELPVTIETESALKLLARLLSGSKDAKTMIKATSHFHTPFGALKVFFEDQKKISEFSF